MRSWELTLDIQSSRLTWAELIKCSEAVVERVDDVTRGVDRRGTDVVHVRGEREGELVM